MLNIQGKPSSKSTQKGYCMKHHQENSTNLMMNKKMTACGDTRGDRILIPALKGPCPDLLDYGAITGCRSGKRQSLISPLTRPGLSEQYAHRHPLFH